MSESRRGRPRDAEAGERLLAAATDALVRHGYAGLSVDEVAERAGVAKTTLYRRWPTKDHLCVAVVARLQAADDITDTGDIRRDLTDYLEKIAGGLNRMRLAGRREGYEGRSAGSVAELVAAAARHDDIGARGELRAGLDAGTLLEQLAGAMYYRVLITGAPVGRDYAEHLVAAALDGAIAERGDTT
jgi:AcrR family transcriptional regulator